MSEWTHIIGFGKQLFLEILHDSCRAVSIEIKADKETLLLHVLIDGEISEDIIELLHRVAAKLVSSIKSKYKFEIEVEKASLDQRFQLKGDVILDRRKKRKERCDRRRDDPRETE